MQDFAITGMNPDRSLLIVQSTIDEDEFTKPYGKMRGYRYKYGINHYSYVTDKANIKRAYNLTEREYDLWDLKFIKRYDPVKDVWYESDELKTYERLCSV